MGKWETTPHFETTDPDHRLDFEADKADKLEGTKHGKGHIGNPARLLHVCMCVGETAKQELVAKA